MRTPPDRHPNRRDALRSAADVIRRFLPLGVVCLSGCAGFWDEVTSKNFKMKSLLSPPEAMVVLRDSTDGDERAKAIRRLKEPKEHGGTDEQQREVVDKLIQVATSDRQPLCRLAAVEKLGHFKDPRVLDGLEAAFLAAQDLPPELMIRVQCQAIQSIGQTGNPAAVKFLIDKLKEPPAERTDYAQQRSDRCIAAARALAHFKDPQATAALAQAMQREKSDVALRDSIHEALVKETGKDLPPDPEAWRPYMNPAEAMAQGDNDSGPIRLMKWLSPQR